MSDPLWHLMEWIEEDALLARPSVLTIRVTAERITAEHDGRRESPLSAWALCRIVARRCARLARVTSAEADSTESSMLEALSDGTSRVETSQAAAARETTRHTFIEWERSPPAAAAAGPSSAAAGAAVQLQLWDLRAFLHFVHAGCASPVTFLIQTNRCQPRTIKYEPPLPDLRETTAQWLHRAPADIGWARSVRDASVVIVTVAIVVEPSGVASESSLHLLPLVDGLPLPAHKQRELASQSLSELDWSRYGLSQPALLPAAADGSATERAPAEPRLTTGAGSSGASSLDDPLFDNAYLNAALRLGLSQLPPAKSAKASTAAAASAAPQLTLFVCVFVHVLALSQRGTASVLHWDELTSEQRGLIAPTLAGALDDLRDRSPIAKQALRSPTERNAALVRETAIPQMAASLAALAAGSTRRRSAKQGESDEVAEADDDEGEYDDHDGEGDDEW